MRRSFLLLLLLLGFNSLGIAGITGKVEGVVSDIQTGAPLVGVNVILQGTSLGAASDQSGYYVILNVPAGRYSVKAIMIGYREVTVNDVRVSIDLTTKLNFQLGTETLKASESVVVVAERPLLRRDEFTSRTTVSAEDIDLQPIDNFQDIARNQAGVVGSHFRGGRSGEVLVLIDGIPVRDPAGEYSGQLGGFTSDIPESGIQEMEVTLGGFSAEYGNVQSGVLNLAMKEGGHKYAGRVRVLSTNFGSGMNDLLMGERDRWFNTRYQHKLENIYQFSLSGPEPISKTLFNKSGLINFSFSGEITDRTQSYFINENIYKQSYQGKLTARLSQKTKISMGGLYSDKEWDSFYFPASKYGPGDDYMVNDYGRYETTGSSTIYHYIYVDRPDQYEQGAGMKYDDSTHFVFGGNSLIGDSVVTFYVGPMQDYLWNRRQKSNTAYLVWTHTLTPRTYYELRYQQFHTNYHYATPDIDDRDGDGDRNEDLVWDIDRAGPHPTYRERDENTYWWVRGDDPGYRDQSSWTKTLKGDLVSQVNSNHLIKSGVEFNYHEMAVENISWTLGVGINRKDIWKEDMIDLGMYIQDKMDFEGIIALIGLRYDYFDPNGFGDAVYYPEDYNYPFTSVDTNDAAIFTAPRKATNKSQISPRLAISHPITERDIIRFSYGHYFQRPDGYYLYRNLSFQSLTKTGNNVGNPNLSPEKTVAYEVGLEHLFTDNIKFSINGYYKDVTNLMNNQKFVLRSANNKEVRIFVNADYGNMKGLEFTLIKRVGHFWGGSVNYTFAIAKGRSSSSGSGSGAFTSERRLNIMSFDQTHTVNANITMRTPDNFIKGLNNWRANIQFGYGSGLPYTSYGSGKINDKRMPWTSNTDLRISKRVDFLKIKMDVFMDIFNLFNRENVDWIGNAQWYEIGDTEDETVKDDPAVVRRDGITGEFIRNPQVYSDKRQFRFGIAVEF